LTVQLQFVERAVGFTIIERGSPLRPTTKGEAFIEQARRILRMLSDATAIDQ
jgi:DNA-binding transcriptional LysR family regulator